MLKSSCNQSLNHLLIYDNDNKLHIDLVGFKNIEGEIKRIFNFIQGIYFIESCIDEKETIMQYPLQTVDVRLFKIECDKKSNDLNGIRFNLLLEKIFNNYDKNDENIVFIVSCVDRQINQLLEIWEK